MTLLHKQQEYKVINWIQTYLLRHLQVFFYSLGQLTRNPLSLLMTSAVIGIALALPTGLHIILKNIQTLSGDLDSAAQISLFLKKSTTDSQAQQLIKQLNKMPQINKIQYISREKALAEFKQLSGFGNALKALEKNPLPAVVIVQPNLLQDSAINNTRATEALMKNLQSQPYVDIAQLDMQWVKRLYSIMDIIRRGVIILAGLLALAVLLVVGNTIRLAIQNRRDEIVIIKLIGGTDRFIRRPFLYTGFWYGLLGGVIALFLVISSLLLLSGPIEALTQSYESSFAVQIIDINSTFWLIAGSILLGLVGSWVAVERHLREIEPS